mmetsp:Transcript_9109/g.17951  ORF Transcript_9109/g.17951 Transcript_9109/m.17951 type:complete len:219 (-) Transcript_9109:598-1254(-)
MRMRTTETICLDASRMNPAVVQKADPCPRMTTLATLAALVVMIADLATLRRLDPRRKTRRRRRRRRRRSQPVMTKRTSSAILLVDRNLAAMSKPLTPLVVLQHLLRLPRHRSLPLSAVVMTTLALVPSKDLPRKRSLLLPQNRLRLPTILLPALAPLLRECSLCSKCKCSPTRVLRWTFSETPRSPCHQCPRRNSTSREARCSMGCPNSSRRLVDLCR